MARDRVGGMPEFLHPLTETTDAAKQGACGVRWLGNAFFFKPLRTRQTVHSRKGDFRSRGAALSQNGKNAFFPPVFGLRSPASRVIRYNTRVHTPARS